MATRVLIPIQPSAKMPPSAPPRVRGRRTAPGGVATIQENRALPDRSSRVRQKHNPNGVIKPILKKDTDPPKEKKKLHWNRKVEKKRHYRIQDLTQEEVESIWYQEYDTKIILAMAKVTVKMMMKGEPCDDDDYCSRGLEGKTPTGSKRRQKNKMKVRKALLEEQDIQREEGVNDPEYLGQVSRKYSEDIVQQAHSQGLRDEQEAMAYLSDIRD